MSKVASDVVVDDDGDLYETLQRVRALNGRLVKTAFFVSVLAVISVGFGVAMFLMQPKAEIRAIDQVGRNATLPLMKTLDDHPGRAVQGQAPVAAVKK